MTAAGSRPSGTTNSERPLPEGRYGSNRPGSAQRTRFSKRAYWALGACAVLIGTLVGYLAYVNLGSAPIETQRTSFEGLPDNSMRMTFDVIRDDPGRTAVCIVRVRARDGSEGGRKEVLVPPGGPTTSVTTVVRSTDEPVTAEVFGCSYQVPEYLSTAVRPSE